MYSLQYATFTASSLSGEHFRKLECERGYYGDNLELYSILKGKSLINNAAIISNKLSATSCTTDCDTKVDKQFPTWSKMQQAIESNKERGSDSWEGP